MQKAWMDMPISNEENLKRLVRPEGRADVVLDTDTYNEIDDQYALAYLLRSTEKLNVQALYAAPFFNEKSADPADGMNKSYSEIMNILTLMGENAMKAKVYHGSTSYLPDENTPVISDAANDLAQRAMAYAPECPLYVVAIGAITNIASALLLNPQIRDRIVLIWLGGHSLDWPHMREFNMMQDVAAARVVFDSGVALVSLPCMGVVSSFRTSGPELEYHLRGQNKLCDYLVDVTTREAASHGGNEAWTRIIWDVTAVAWLIDPSFMKERLEHAIIPQYDHHYSVDASRHFYLYVYHVDRDRLFADLFRKLKR